MLCGDRGEVHILEPQHIKALLIGNVMGGLVSQVGNGANLREEGGVRVELHSLYLSSQILSFYDDCFFLVPGHLTYHHVPL